MTKPLNAEALRRQLAGINPARSLERRPSAPEPAISAERAAELRMVLGQLKFLALVRLLAAELIEAPAEMRRLTLESDYSAVRARAHSLLGAAANFGAGSVAAAARATEIALPGAELELALGRLEEESRRARTALLELITIDGNSMLRSA